MVELGKYFVPVLSAYGISMLALAWLIVASWSQSRKTAAALDAAEARREARKAEADGV